MPALLLGLAILIYALSFSYLTVNRYAAFEARALDLGNLHQTVWNTANGRPFHMTNQPGTINRLSLHVEPILLPIAALYWLHDGPETLLILQSIVVALGAWPLYALARHRWRARPGAGWIGLICALLYLLNPTIQAANWLEFHPVTLAPTLLMAAYYFLVTQRNGWFTICALLAASCKEEIGLLLFMLGLYALLVLQRRRLGPITMVLALGWSLFAVLGLQHYFAAGNIHWGRYDYLGASPLDKVLTLLTDPQTVWRQLRAADAAGYLLRLLWPVGFAALFAPGVLLIALPSLAINLLADFPPMHQVYTLIYAAPILPFVMLATVEALTHRADRAAAAGARLRHFATTLAPGWMQPLLLLLAVGGMLIAQQRHGYLPGGGNYRPYSVTDHDRRAAAIIAQIPPTAKVSAQDRLDPHVAGRESVYIFPRVEDADTIFVDVTGSAWPQHPSDLYRDIQQLLAGDFGIAAADDGYLLLRKDSSNTEMPASFYDAFRVPRAHSALGAEKSELLAVFDDAYALLAHELLLDTQGETVTKLYWQLANGPVADDLQIYIAYADSRGNILHDTLFYPPVATLWYPTSLWQPNEIVLVQTLPWQIDVAQVTLLVGIYREATGWEEGQRLQLSAPVGPEQLALAGETVVRLASYQQTATGWQPIDRDNPPVTMIDRAQAMPLALQFATPTTDLQLRGVMVDRAAVARSAGDTLDFTLRWQAGQAPPAFDYAITAQLFAADGAKVAQLDWQPTDLFGPRPMTSWRPEETLWDRQQLPLPATLAPGEYRLAIGVYNWQTGERLVVTAGEPGGEPGGEPMTELATVAQFSVQ